MDERDSTFWKFFWDVAVVVAAAFLYFKTSEVMTVIAPLTLVGQTGLQTLYGLGVAALIEGICLAIHFIKAFRNNVAAQTYKWFLFGVSAFCQFMDRFFVLDTSITSANIEFFKFLTYGIPVAILGGLLLVGKANEKRMVTERRRPFKGVVNYWDEFLHGSKESTVLSQVVRQPKFVPEDQPVPEEVRNNGKVPETENFTKGERS